jgi:hypothetical protein
MGGLDAYMTRVEEAHGQFVSAFSGGEVLGDGRKFEAYCRGRAYHAMAVAYLDMGGNVKCLPEDPEKVTRGKLAELEIQIGAPHRPFFDQTNELANQAVRR